MKIRLLLFLVILLPLFTRSQSYPNPYREVGPWLQLPDGRAPGAGGDVDIDPSGEFIWAIVRCDRTGRTGRECLNSDLDPVLKIDQEGKVVQSFGGGMFIWPHGIEVDPAGNVWVTDAVKDKNIPEGDIRGHQIIKFSAEGKVLMRLGTPGEAGDKENQLNSPSDLVVDKEGFIYVIDGHSSDSNPRVKKFNKNGEFVKQWSQRGYGPGQLQNAHSIAINSKGKLFVADRGNNRIEIFDKEGSFLSTWTQFGKPSGIFIDENDIIYVADSESDYKQNPGWELGIRIGDSESGWVHYFVPLSDGDPRKTHTQGAEFVAVDKYGNMYGGEPRPMKLKKYVRVRK
ncbi:MAG: peptidyl-alpha-hydroxyglycine alpha-amidating lyase family protein [Cyclobacteriaceae bacterium]|uniref:peptidyl-alpha-hydroxyglycine alpha-amidating lyase family protein n=1 Tax=Reichenbachiella sp. TaxID=2184521 RepID=UPI00326657D8